MSDSDAGFSVEGRDWPAKVNYFDKQQTSKRANARKLRDWQGWRSAVVAWKPSQPQPTSTTTLLANSRVFALLARPPGNKLPQLLCSPTLETAPAHAKPSHNRAEPAGTVPCSPAKVLMTLETSSAGASRLKKSRHGAPTHNNHAHATAHSCGRCWPAVWAKSRE